ncbi:hypothetical protein Sjap_015774 [Stephania japonica]|uniref:YdbS-like PH domain-containing protein n=1 Tax=Stephania japonica TaxID=461633 RepID=A0AAP0NR67_9MAGN
MASSSSCTTTPLFFTSQFSPPPKPTTTTTFPIIIKSKAPKLATKLQVSSSPTNNPTTPLKTPPRPPSSQETVFFDGGAHYGDLVANLLLGLTLLWLPLTLASVSRALFLRYRFTNLRVTVISGLTGQDRTDFSYKVVKDVQVVPRFVGEWGDIVITLKDGSKVDLRSVPKFRDVAQYCRDMARSDDMPKGF